MITVYMPWALRGIRLADFAAYLCARKYFDLWRPSGGGLVLMTKKDRVEIRREEFDMFLEMSGQYYMISPEERKRIWTFIWRDVRNGKVVELSDDIVILESK